VLVIPIRYVETLKDLENDEKKDLLMVLKKVNEVVRNVNKTSCVTTGIQTGASAGQTIKVRKCKNSAFIKEEPRKGL
jgi:diadenosine tetraphosphate (Ap4A) HIT family hydrolase